MPVEAVERADNAAEQFAGVPRLQVARAEAHAAAGRALEVEKILQGLEALAQQRYVDPALLAMVHVARADHEAALDLLERAYEVRSGTLQVINIDPRFDPLRGDPRFDDLVRRIGLEPGRPPARGEAT